MLACFGNLWFCVSLLVSPCNFAIVGVFLTVVVSVEALTKQVR